MPQPSRNGVNPEDGFPFTPNPNNQHNDTATPQRVRVQVRIFRVAPGPKVRVRTLSPSYIGIYTHWDKARRRSIYCPGETCRFPECKRFRKYKGYAAVQVLDETAKRLIPFVLEISPNLEQDLVGKYRRGQVWDLFRETEGGKKGPVRGEHVVDCDPKSFASSFDVRPVVMRMYDEREMVFNAKNDLPERQFAEESEPIRVGTTPPAVPPAAEYIEEVMGQVDEVIDDARPFRMPPVNNGHVR